MIYIYVWDTRTTKEAFYSIRTSDLAGRPWQKRCLQTPCNCFHCDELPLFIQHDLVGMDMAREVAAAYYRAMPPDRFKFDITSLRYYLMEDHFHLGVVPAEHIRRLRIIVSPVECAELAEEINEKICISARGQELVDANLQELDVIRYKYGFRLTVVLGSGISGAWTDSTMEAFRDTYDMLTAAGVRFRVYGRSSKSH
ncbi:hypothetical protein CC86DRAFT_116706 [Ophiobolus disseminans]|uniref:Uncharacterized protein n=1 Tax=Ophiobolus disseminans TaxID=1469910 RepID=A0A6A6ZIA0_9PLEO|nr:hypothetical protein CC86DRAFT_116706 [Ophiobolus disseminans]